LRTAIEYDEGYMGGAGGFVSKLETQLTVILTSLKSGDYKLSKEDLAFMPIVNSVNDILLQFKHLLRLVNYTHTLNLDN